MLTDVLADPSCFFTLSAKDQSKLVAEARYFNMLAQLKPTLENCTEWDDLQPKIKKHITAAHTVFAHQQTRLAYENMHFQQLFSRLDIEWIYLKGAAYHLAGFKEFDGRLMSDIDILVTEDSLPRVEKALQSQGWSQTHLNDYDQKFYRQWAQEIPPMRHKKRRTELDLHFNILPKTIKESPNPAVLMAQTGKIEASETAGKTLNPAAMTIHNSIHLFYESDFSKGIRDLYDFYLLVMKFSVEPSFWQEVMSLQSRLGNGDSMFYALRYCHRAFQLNIPQEVEEFYRQYKSNKLKTYLSDFAFKRVLFYAFPENRLPGHQLAVWMLYIRGHLKRMPLKLLIPHLIKKTIKKYLEGDEKEVLFRIN